jgi:hypothetical protein
MPQLPAMTPDVEHTSRKRKGTGINLTYQISLAKLDLIIIVGGERFEPGFIGVLASPPTTPIGRREKLGIPHREVPRAERSLSESSPAGYARIRRIVPERQLALRTSQQALDLLRYDRLHGVGPRLQLDTKPYKGIHV